MNPLDLVREVLKAEAARFIAYSTLLALTAANAVGHALGYSALPDGIANGLTILVGALVTEAIRRFVYSTNSVEKISGQAIVSAGDDVEPDGEPVVGNPV